MTLTPLTLLRTGRIDVIGRMPWSSNGTFLVEVAKGDACTRAVYKPVRGERPLWDFPAGLYRREVAAWVLADALGWDMVPPTTTRDDAPLGEGSLQLFIDADFEQHYFTLLEDEATHPQLRRICAFDVLANSTDRKSGHCLIDADRHLWGIDNGLSFAPGPKLRTVIWDFGGEPLPDELVEAVTALVDADLAALLRHLLSPEECDAVGVRALRLLRAGTFPVDPSGRRYPWPLI